MNVFAKFDEIPSMTLQNIKETKCYGQTFVRSVGQHENSIPSHKLGGRGYNDTLCVTYISPAEKSKQSDPTTVIK